MTDRSIITINGLTKVYQDGMKALDDVSLAIREGEILALLGPNGAGKTTLIGAVCGVLTPTAGTIRVAGHDVVADARAARTLIGLVPQEINLNIFLTVVQTLRYQRGFYGRRHDGALEEEVLRLLSLTDKRDTRIMALSGGMKRRVLIAKALMNEPRILFLDEPTAGVDVELRRGMWDAVRALRDRGTTVILTTHYLEEAEELADRIGIITGGRLHMVEETAALMRRMGHRMLTVTLSAPVTVLPDDLTARGFSLSQDGLRLTATFENATEAHIPGLLRAVETAGLTMIDVDTDRSSLEDIFMTLIGQK